MDGVHAVGAGTGGQLSLTAGIRFTTAHFASNCTPRTLVIGFPSVRRYNV